MEFRCKRIRDYLLRLGMNQARVEMLGMEFVYIEVHAYSFNHSEPCFNLKWVESKLHEKFPEIYEKEVALCTFEIEYG